MNEKPIIVLDTNVFLVSLAPQSPYSLIFDALIDGKFILAFSTEILSEYEEIILTRYDKLLVNDVFELMLHLPNVIRQDVYFRWNLIENDKDDNKFVDCAVAVGADYLVTNDRHFHVLLNLPFPKVDIIKADPFLNLLHNI